LKSFSIRESIRRFDDQAYMKGKELSKKLEESKIKESMLRHTNSIIDQSFGISATVFLKSQDTYTSLKESMDMKKIKEKSEIKFAKA